MPNTALIPALAKTLLAIAWADGELHPEEEATIKEVLGLLPELSAQEWAVIELYLVAPINDDERAELLQNTLSHIRSAEDKRIALEAVDAMLNADGLVHPAEAEVASEVRRAIAGADVSPFGRLGRAVGGAIRRVPRREGELMLWRTNPVAFLLRQRSGSEIDVSDRAVAIASLAAAIMLQVARLNPATADAVRPIMVRALHTDWQMPPPLAEQIAAAALAVIRRHVDDHRIARELAARTTEAQRVALLDTLFAIANSVDQVAPAEIDEIRVIAERLQLTRQQFIDAKLKIPAAERGGL